MRPLTVSVTCSTGGSRSRGADMQARLTGSVAMCMCPHDGRTWLLHSARGAAQMDDGFFPVTCPYCGEPGEIFVESDVGGQFVQDCEVCCNPWLVRVSRDEEGRRIELARADGSE